MPRGILLGLALSSGWGGEACKSGGMEEASVDAPVGTPRSEPVLPLLQLRQLRVRAPASAAGPAKDKVVRFAAPGRWNQQTALEAHSLRLTGAGGEGEITVLAAVRPDGLGPLLSRLRLQNPGTAPSPPEAMEVEGIDPERGERATRFVITGAKVGEMVMIERGGVIVLFAAIVAPKAWPDLAPLLARCYSTVDVQDVT